MNAKEVISLVNRTQYVLLKTLEPDRAIKNIQMEGERRGDNVYAVIPVVKDGEVKISLTQNIAEDGILFDDELEVAGKILELINEDERSIFVIHQPNEEFFTSNAFWNTLITGRVAGLPRLILVGTNPKPASEYRRYFHLADFDLPDKKEREIYLVEMIKEGLRYDFGVVFDDEDVIKLLGDKMEKIVELGKGLTAKEFLDACALAITTDEVGGEIKVEVDLRKMIKVKENLIRQNPVLEIYHPEEVDELIGFERAWQITEKAFEKKMQKGLLLLGIPGIGKSLFAKNIAKRYEIPTVFLDLSRVFSSYVGESEKRIDDALKTIEELGECIVVIDEIDKAMAGMGAGGRTDSGVSERVFGKFHTWLQDRKSKAFIIATANKISHLPASLFRAGRWNATLFVDYYPTPAHYEKLLNVYVKKYNLNPKLIDIEPKFLFDKKFTGAEVSDLVEKAYLFDVPLSQVIKERWVVPLSEREPEKIREYIEEGKGFPSAHTNASQTTTSPRIGKNIRRLI